MFDVLLYKTKKRRKFMNKLKEYTEKMFEDIKHIDDQGNEYWLARELQSILGYHQWRSINDLIKKLRLLVRKVNTTQMIILRCTAK